MALSGNGNGANGLNFKIKKQASRFPAAPSQSDAEERGVVFQNAKGVTLRGMPLRVRKQNVLFELYDLSVALQMSQVLHGFKIVLRKRSIYSGSAVICNLLNTGVKFFCEATLNEGSWLGEAFTLRTSGKDRLHKEFDEFVRDWQETYLLGDDYKVVVADLQSLLTGLRLWLEQLEMEIRCAPAADQNELVIDIAKILRAPITRAIGHMFERFESVSDKIDEGAQSAHGAYGRQHLHPLLLCSPFLHRTYTKPLGYAGDYEMMNMINRNGLEGNSIYAKLVNAYLLEHTPCRAVRSRADFLTQKIIDETGRVSRAGRTSNVYSIACGPIWEVVNFLARSSLADFATFRLLDFDEETLQYAANRINEAKEKYHRKTQVKVVKHSVQNLLRSSGKSAGELDKFDLIYCSGLYDYLNDNVCRLLNTYFYDRLRPGGLLVIGNFASCTPGQYLMEHLMEWFLIYRDNKQLTELAPEQAREYDCRVKVESSGYNLFLEIRKPE